jgi:hypothetical protein
MGARDGAATPVPLACMRQHAVVQAAAGDEHALLVTSHGHLYACGRSDLGQLGMVVPPASSDPLHGTDARRPMLVAALQVRWAR